MAAKKDGSDLERAKFTYEFSALFYLNWWLRFDRRFCAALADNAAPPAQRLLMLQEAAGVYRIARNLETKYDTKVGKGRLAPVLEILDACSAKDFTHKKWIKSLESVRGEISNAYGDAGALSFSTKVVWLRFKRPVIIYDANARSVIGTDDGDLASFSKEWRKAYSKARSEIDAACKLLPSIARFSVFGNHVTSRSITELTKHDWFKERVFDSWLWHTGG